MRAEAYIPSTRASTILPSVVPTRGRAWRVGPVEPHDLDRQALQLSQALDPLVRLGDDHEAIRSRSDKLLAQQRSTATLHETEIGRDLVGPVDAHVRPHHPVECDHVEPVLHREAFGDQRGRHDVQANEIVTASEQLHGAHSARPEPRPTVIPARTRLWAAAAAAARAGSSSNPTTAARSTGSHRFVTSGGS